MSPSNSRRAPGLAAKTAFICNSRETSGSWFSTFATRDWLDPMSFAQLSLRQMLLLPQGAYRGAQAQLRLDERLFRLRETEELARRTDHSAGSEERMNTRDTVDQ